jgi:hypothetical protein
MSRKSFISDVNTLKSLLFVIIMNEAERRGVYDYLRQDQFLLKMVSMGFQWWHPVSVTQCCY